MNRGFSLLEVTVAIVILAGTLISLTRIISYSYSYSEKIDRIYQGTELAWLKLHDIEEDIKKNGIPTAEKSEEGEFDDKAFEGFKWKYTIKRVYVLIPDMSSPDSGSGGEGQQEQAGDMLMGVKSMIEDFFRERIRKLSLVVYWGEGKKESEKVVFTIFLTTDGTVQEFKQATGMPGGNSQNPNPNQNPNQKKPGWDFNNSNQQQMQNSPNQINAPFGRPKLPGGGPNQ